MFVLLINLTARCENHAQHHRPRKARIPHPMMFVPACSGIVMGPSVSSPHQNRSRSLCRNQLRWICLRLQKWSLCILPQRYWRFKGLSILVSASSHFPDPTNTRAFTFEIKVAILNFVSLLLDAFSLKRLSRHLSFGCRACRCTASRSRGTCSNQDY